MALTKYKLGQLIEPCDIRNQDLKYGLDALKGISTGKEFIETKANMDGVSLTSYKLVMPLEFAYVADTSRRGDKIALAHNTTSKGVLISSIYTVFRVKDTETLNPDYLSMYFNRPEFDRYSRFNSWGSARETFSWEDMCDIDIELPSIDIQKKYLAIYNSLLANQKSYERGLDDLKLTCDAYIEDLRRKMPSEKIGKYITEVSNKDVNFEYSTDDIRGVSINKEFIETKANTNDLTTVNYKLVKKNQFAFNPNTARMGDKFSIALNNTEEVYLVSSIYPVFEIKLPYKLDPNYLMIFFKRVEFDRYVRFNSWGSAREMFNYEDMTNVSIPIPNIDVQKSIADIFSVYNRRSSIKEQIRKQIKDICPILIKGSIEEAKQAK